MSCQREHIVNINLSRNYDLLFELYSLKNGLPYKAHRPNAVSPSPMIYFEQTRKILGFLNRNSERIPRSLLQGNLRYRLRRIIRGDSSEPLQRPEQKDIIAIRSGQFVERKEAPLREKALERKIRKILGGWGSNKRHSF